MPLAYTTAYTVFGLGCIVASRIPNNAGSLGAAHRVGARGLHPQRAASRAAVCIRHIIGQMLPDVVFGCLAQAIPDRVPAEGTSCLWNIIVRGSVKGGSGGNYGFTMAITSNGGTGARPHADGLSATAYPSGVKGTPVEIAEAITPLIFWKKELRPGSGGAGPHARRPRPDHRDRERHRRAVRAAGRLRPHRPSRRAAAHGGKAGAAGAVAIKGGRSMRGKGTQSCSPASAWWS